MANHLLNRQESQAGDVDDKKRPSSDDPFSAF
jgi:hypothetical protein